MKSFCKIILLIIALNFIFIFGFSQKNYMTNIYGCWQSFSMSNINGVKEISSENKWKYFFGCDNTYTYIPYKEFAKENNLNSDIQYNGKYKIICTSIPSKNKKINPTLKYELIIIPNGGIEFSMKIINLTIYELTVFVSFEGEPDTTIIFKRVLCE